jgi:hypothetical protein
MWSGKVDKELKQMCLTWLDEHGGSEPSVAIATKSFSIDQAKLAENLDPAKTRGEKWSENAREDEQLSMFTGDERGEV